MNGRCVIANARALRLSLYVCLIQKDDDGGRGGRGGRGGGRFPLDSMAETKGPFIKDVRTEGGRGFKK